MNFLQKPHIFHLKDYRASDDQHEKLIICLFKAKISKAFYTSTDKSTGQRINVRNFWKIPLCDAWGNSLV